MALVCRPNFALAMAHWGIGLVTGPHINNPVVDEAHAEVAWKALIARVRETLGVPDS